MNHVRHIIYSTEVNRQNHHTSYKNKLFILDIKVKTNNVKACVPLKINYEQQNQMLMQRSNLKLKVSVFCLCLF